MIHPDKYLILMTRERVKSGNEILEILDNLHNEGKTIIMVTHENIVADRAERLVRFKDGHIISDGVEGSGRR